MSATLLHPADLEPSLLKVRTYASRRRRAHIDAAALLSFMVALLYCLPATLIVPELTFAGRPALLVAFALICWWSLTRLHPRLVMSGAQPMRWAAFAYLLSFVLSYLAGTIRGLPQVEANGQDFAMIVMIEFLGVVLIAADGVPNWQRFAGVLKMLVWSAGFAAVVGLVQSVTAFDITRYMVLPGLGFHGEAADFAARGDGGLFRVASTTAHYIEFSTVMALAVPFAIHFARFAPSRGGRITSAVLALLITSVIPLTVSRTGVLALAVTIAVVFVLAWSWRTRYHILVFGVATVAGLMLVKPGLLGTLGSLFASAADDPSIQGRTQDYEYVAYWFAQRPWLGRGPGTLIPDLYLILDNQWLGTLVTGGIVGVAAFAGLHITGITLASIGMRRARRPEERDLCAALIAAQVTSMLVSGTFDSLSFTTFSFTLALTCGLSGAAWRLTHPQRRIRTSTVRWLAD
ncbi:O-antigen ligase family protein [Micromonospora echinaurantiaca]|uniref:O-antigen ligase family protein n=1 Tax=Micromonospora echinaurantiaca TaxID=47857 RepID=UPI00343E9E43